MSDRERPRVQKRGDASLKRARADLRWLYGVAITRLRQGEPPSPRAVTTLAALAQLSPQHEETLRVAHQPSRGVPRALRLLVAPLAPGLVVLVATRKGLAPEIVGALFGRAIERRSPVERFEARRAVDALIVEAQRELADALRAYSAIRARPLNARELATWREAFERAG